MLQNAPPLRRLGAATASLLALFACSDSDGTRWPAWSSIAVLADFETGPLDAQKDGQPMASATPIEWNVKICQFVLWNPGTDERHEVFGVDDMSACPVFRFTADERSPQELFGPDGTFPDAPGYNVAELHIVYMEMLLSFGIDATNDIQDRRLRIYYDQDGEWRPGDVAVVGGDRTAWAFGDGNLVHDSSLEGLPRAQAYTLDRWPRGHSTAEWGPFGDAAFWASHPPNPFIWRVPLPTVPTDTALIVFRVADTWRYTDVNGSGRYDWPSDYAGGLWNMQFPWVEGVVAVDETP
jgi:hypothetical protein